MRFLTIQDIHNYFKYNVLVDVLEINMVDIPSSGYTATDLEIENYISGNTILTATEDMSLELINGWIGSYYDTVLEFTKTGSTRNGVLVEMAVAIMIYKLHCRMNSGNVPENALFNFNQTISQLEKIALKKLPINIAIKDNTVEGTVNQTEWYCKNETNETWQ